MDFRGIIQHRVNAAEKRWFVPKYACVDDISTRINSIYPKLVQMAVNSSTNYFMGSPVSKVVFSHDRTVMKIVNSTTLPIDCTIYKCTVKKDIPFPLYVDGATLLTASLSNCEIYAAQVPTTGNQYLVNSSAGASGHLDNCFITTDPAVSLDMMIDFNHYISHKVYKHVKAWPAGKEMQVSLTQSTRIHHPFDDTNNGNFLAKRGEKFFFVVFNGCIVNGANPEGTHPISYDECSMSVICERRVTFYQPVELPKTVFANGNEPYGDSLALADAGGWEQAVKVVPAVQTSHWSGDT